MASARKRPRVEAEDNRAECPFSIKIVDPRDKEHKKKKRRRTDGGTGEEEDTIQRINLQMSPFTPSGKFKSFETMDLHYQVDPAKQWTDMTRYNSFVLNGVKYFSEGFIYVANDSSIERQKAVVGGEPMQPRKKSDDDWVARILEIRARDEHHVYARVYWMYWPDELPQGTHDGKRTVHGRQTYHGMNELIASNHMDIINVVSVTSPAVVKQWYEENDDEIQNALYWRQAFDVRTYELSNVELVCSCHTPAHPDKLLIGCTTESCKKWMHESCIKEEALRRTFKRLGTDKPHLPPELVKESKEKEAKDEATRPLSPTEMGASVAAQHSIDVKAEGEPPSDAVHVDTKDNVEVRQQDDEDAPAAPEDALADADTSPSSAEHPRRTTATGNKGEAADVSTPAGKATSGKATTSGKKAGRPKKKGEANGTGEGSRPWDGLFEVALKTVELGPPVLEFKDLRQGIVGGEKTWTEPVECLICGDKVN